MRMRTPVTPKSNPCRVYFHGKHLLTEGMRSLLRDVHKIEMVGSGGDATALEQALREVRPEVVILERSEGIISADILAVIQRSASVKRTVVLDPKKDCFTVYERHEVNTIQPEEVSVNGASLSCAITAPRKED